MWPLALLLLGLSSVFCEEEKVSRVAATDSYLEAYKATRGDSANALLDKAIRKTDREYVEPGGFPYPNPQSQYGPPNFNYGPPRPQYGPPNPAPAYSPPNPPAVYGPPNPPPVYGPPALPPPVYGPPAPPPPVYGPPAPPPPVYGAPSSVQVFYGVPHAMLNFWDKLKYKLDLFTIGKILLKLVIFKKIVSFIAIICLLLFIPALKHKGGNDNEDNFMASDEDEMMMRNLNMTRYSGYDEKLNNLAKYVRGAIENFTETNQGRARCDNMYCETQTVLKKLKKKMSYKRLATLYSNELQAQ